MHSLIMLILSDADRDWEDNNHALPLGEAGVGAHLAGLVASASDHSGAGDSPGPVGGVGALNGAGGMGGMGSQGILWPASKT